jgi:hypothetical protein
VKTASSSESRVYKRELKKFPIPLLKILPVGLMIALSAGCHSSTASVEASTARNPVVAPAGTVLRVRLNQTLETGRSRPGDRFSGTLDAPVMAGTLEILPKGTKVEGHIEPAVSSKDHLVLALALDCYEREGGWNALSTQTVAWTGSPQRAGAGLRNVVGAAVGAGISVAAESIIGFTLTSTLSA